MAALAPLKRLGRGLALWAAGDFLPVALGGTGATTAAAALGNLGLNSAGALSFRNRLINGGFAVNQRGFATGTAASAGFYAHDRWKAGANGCTYTFTQTQPTTTITITANTLTQVVEAANVEGGTYTLSWAGTATARVYQGAASGSYAASPITVTGLSANTATTVEFSTGTLGKVQLEPGASASAFELRPYGVELGLAQRYFAILYVPPLQSAASSGAQSYPMSFHGVMRAVPQMTTIAAPTYSNTSGASFGGATVDAVSLTFTTSASGGYLSGWTISANAEL